MGTERKGFLFSPFRNGHCENKFDNFACILFLLVNDVWLVTGLDFPTIRSRTGSHSVVVSMLGSFWGSNFLEGRSLLQDFDPPSQLRVEYAVGGKMRRRGLATCSRMPRLGK